MNVGQDFVEAIGSMLLMKRKFKGEKMIIGRELVDSGQKSVNRVGISMEKENSWVGRITTFDILKMVPAIIVSLNG